MYDVMGGEEMMWIQVELNDDDDDASDAFDDDDDDSRISLPPVTGYMKNTQIVNIIIVSLIICFLSFDFQPIELGSRI